MKDEVLRMLREGEGFVSGEDMCRVLGVTRTAVWKYINALKSEGYEIESSSKKGYKLIGAPDILDMREMGTVLKTRYIGREILHFDSIDSTNTAARKKAMEGCSEGLVVISEEQVSGRGRLGRRWSTPKGQAIAFSLVLRPDIKPEEASGITLVMGTAVCRAVRKMAGLKAGIKWPNDIIVNGKKVCGILTEMNGEIDAINYIVAGVGINVNINEFPGELKEIATSLSIEAGKKISRKELLASVLLEFESLYDDFKFNGLECILDEFKSYSVTLGKPVKVISVNETFEGEAIDIAESGLLIVKLKDGTERRIISGDVSVRGINGYV